MQPPSFDIHPLTPARFADLADLFGPRGAVSGCWCMWWRLSHHEFRSTTPEEHRAALEALTQTGAPVGLLAYADGKPVGWVSVAPREQYRRFYETKTRTWQIIDDRPVWCIVCFFIAPGWRRKGAGSALLAAAVAYAREHGALTLEASPVEPARKNASPLSIYYGTAAMFQKAGFSEVARFHPTHPIYRLELD